jgi:serine/threonine protein kinase
LLPPTPSEALDLLNKMVVLNPKKRISVQEVATHPFLAMTQATEFSEQLTASLKSLDEVEKLTQPK